MKRLAAVLLTVCLLCVSVFAAGSFLDGTYYGMAKGRNGWISVSVAVEDGCVAAVEVDGPEETPGKLGQAMQIVGRLIGCGDLESVQAVDAVSGATMSSEGIKNAVLNALQTAVPAWLHGEGTACPGAAFADLPAYGHWAHIPIDWAVTTGVTTGTSKTTFSPNAPCTRAQIVTFLYRAFGTPACRGGHRPPAQGAGNEADERGSSLQEKTDALRFTDVPADAWYAEAVLWAVENGITTGTSPTTFSPNAPCTRAQAATFLWRSAGSPVCRDKPCLSEMAADEQGSSLQEETDALRFTDVPADAWYTEAVLWAVEHGVTQGVSQTEFAPNQPCTRAQIVTFLYRARLLTEEPT